ncbi:MAG: TonB-dependent receptor, partial [Pseudomonadota bacterium]
TDQQIAIPGESGSIFDFDISNVGESELYGLEIAAEFEATSALSVFASLGLQRAQFTNFPFAVDRDPVTDELVPVNPDFPRFAFLDGFDFPNAPSVTASAGFSYRHRSGFIASGNAAYTGTRFQGVDNLPIEQAESLTLVNARLGYRYETVEISVYANNLFDDRFLAPSVANVNTGTGLPQPSTAPEFSTNDPRLWGVELRASF